MQGKIILKDQTEYYWRIWDEMIMGTDIYKISDEFRMSAEWVFTVLKRKIDRFRDQEERRYLKTRLKEIAPDFISKQGMGKKSVNYVPNVKNYAYYKVKYGKKLSPF